jgi:hypothetical protein
MTLDRWLVREKGWEKPHAYRAQKKDSKQKLKNKPKYKKRTQKKQQTQEKIFQQLNMT